MQGCALVRNCRDRVYVILPEEIEAALLIPAGDETQKLLCNDSGGSGAPVNWEITQSSLP